MNAPDNIAARFALDRARKLKADAEEARLSCEQFAAGLADADKMVVAMGVARDLLADLLAGWRRDLAAELTEYETPDAIHARLTEVVRDGLAAWSAALSGEAKAAAGEDGSAVDKLVAHGGGLWLGRCAQACAPRPHLTVSQWADDYRWLSSKGSGEPGKWRTERNPLLREIMDCFSIQSNVRRIAIKKPSQNGATEAMLNVIGYTMHHAPGPLMVLLPTLENRGKWEAQKLMPLLTDTPVIADIFDARSQRDGANSQDIKDFPGGALFLGGGNSPNSYAQVSARIVMLDDFDRFPREVGEEGDPAELARGRTKAFSRYKLAFVSTPTIKDASNIDDEYEKSDQSTPLVACPHCGEYQPLVWGNLTWPGVAATTGRVTHAWYVCDKNGCIIEEHEKPAMLESVRWVAKYPERSAHHRGFTWNSLLTPTGLGKSWVELAQQWIDAQKNPAKLKTFINTELAEVWEDRSNSIKPKHLSERAIAGLKAREIPLGCLMLVAGVDVQRGTRLEVQVMGIGPLPGGRVGQDFIHWTIDYAVLPGDPAKDEVWKLLATYLNTPFINQRGRQMLIEAAAIDEGDGFHTHDVRAFAMSGAARRLMSVKGLNRPSRSVMPGGPKPVELNRRGKIEKRGAVLWDVGTDEAKKYLYGRLLTDAELPAHEQRIRFHGELEDAFYEGLLAETFDPERNRFVAKKGRRNEPLDTWGYAWFAAHHPQINVKRKPRSEWDALALLLEPEAQEDGTIPPPPVPAPARKPAAPTGGGFGRKEWEL